MFNFDSLEKEFILVDVLNYAPASNHKEIF